MVRKGMCWRIGDGKTVKVWKDLGSRLRNQGRLFLQLVSLMKIWRLVLLFIQFLRVGILLLLLKKKIPLEQQHILSIALSHRFLNDSIFWALENNGRYSVKLAYKDLFHDKNDVSMALSSTASSLWNHIWNFSLLPRVKLFA